MATLAEIREAVLNNLERTTEDSSTDSSNVDRWINRTIREEFCSRYNWEAMEATYTVNTVADQEMYPFPSSNTKDIKQIALRLSSDSAYRPLLEESQDQLDEEIPLVSVSGTPVAWCRAGSAFRLRPAPRVSTFGLRVRCWDYPAELTNDSDTNYWTLNMQGLIEDFATAYGFRWLGDTEEYATLWQAAMATLSERIGNDAKRLRPKRQTIAPSTRAGRPASTAWPRLGESGYYRQYP